MDCFFKEKVNIDANPKQCLFLQDKLMANEQEPKSVTNMEKLAEVRKHSERDPKMDREILTESKMKGI